jgi:hypothetical protein
MNSWPYSVGPDLAVMVSVNMVTLTSRIALLGVVLPLLACGVAQPRTKNLGMLMVASRMPAEQRWAYLTARLAQDGWQLENTDSSRAEVVAFKTDLAVSDVRDHLVVRIGPAISAAVIQSELFVDNKWETTRALCPSYAWAREKQIIGGMEEFLAANPVSPVLSMK